MSMVPLPPSRTAIAVVGLSCRLPQAPDPQAFWQLLRSGTDAIIDTPPQRWRSADESLRRGGFLDTVTDFDAAFFGISAREAIEIDPQQRLMLELAWQAFEDALGRRPGRTGVFVGAMADDYRIVQQRRGDAAIAHHTGAGASRGVIANRISHLLGLRGPSLTVDTGQSSSLVAVHLAMESLRRGESTTALAGGVQLNLVEDSALRMSRFGGLSPDGRCYTFDARANGFVRGEGGGFVVLKTMPQALADGDRIYAVLRGSALGNDGAGKDLTTPTGDGQRAVLREAYRAAGVDPAAVAYVELHGTGTRVGDPVEAEALGAELGAQRRTPLLVGSAKTNIGHLEGAAGIAGLLKVVLAVHHDELPPSLNFRTPNPAVRWMDWRLEVVTGRRAWPDGERVAGVSAFGMGGTNCHVVVAAPEPAAADRPAGGDAPSGPAVAARPVPWVFSAVSDAGLRALAADLRAGLPDSDAALPEIARTFAARFGLTERAVVFGQSADELSAGLQQVSQGTARVVTAREEWSDDRPLPVSAGPSATFQELTTLWAFPTAAAESVAFVFPGQGGQWTGMGARLWQTSAVFRAWVRVADEVIAAEAGWSVREVLLDVDGAPSLDRVDVVQPALFVTMVGIALVWAAWGIAPDAVVGHSQGEVAAAFVAGALTLGDAVRVVAGRSALVARRLSGAGRMAVVWAPADSVRARLVDGVSVAAINGPATTVLTGDPEALAASVSRYDDEGVRVRWVDVDYASHSPQVEPVRAELVAELAAVRPRRPQVSFYSSVTGAHLDAAELDAEYWFRNLREPVNFAGAVDALVAEGFRTFVECSPHPSLAGAVEDAAGPQAVVLSSLRRDDGAANRLLESLAQAWVAGVGVEWSSVVGPGARRPAPRYSFRRTTFWPGVATAEEPDRPAPGTRWNVLPPARRRRELHELIRAEAVAVGAADISDTAVSFTGSGFDSVMAIELRNRLSLATGLSLPASVLFDHPSPDRLADHLVNLLNSAPAPALSPPLVGDGVQDTGNDVPDDSDAIAIVSMACRYPGGADTPEKLWDLVVSGRDAVGPFPADRGWDLAGLFDDEPGRVGKSSTRAGGFLYDAPRFDAELFGISPREAAAMDPQQRLLLETSWELFERAGLNVHALRGSDTGVFIGAMAPDYGPRMSEAGERAAGYVLTGTTGGVASGRISYVHGFTGPTLTVDTACSSSLVALHLAAAALRRGECSLAVAGGATVMSTPGIFIEFSQQRGLSPDGRCRAFGAGADGTGWAEGVGVLLLERLSDARRHGHRVLAVLRGSAVNSDGASNGLTAPNGPSQERVIRRALADAGLTTADIDVVEAHGTGTALGDPIEAHALLATYGRGRAGGHPLRLGSLKSNIGHSQAAAGVGGVIKMVQALRHGVLPRTLHADRPSPLIDWAAGQVELLTGNEPWPATGRPRRAAVSSFGIGGTNAHVVLEQAPVVADAAPAPRSGPVPWILSAASADGVREHAAALADFARRPDAPHPRGVAAALATRATLAERAVVIGRTPEDFADALHRIAQAPTRVVAAVPTPVPPEHEPVPLGNAALTFPELLAAFGFRFEPVEGVAVLFPGQGGQWSGMGAELWDSSSVFRAWVSTLDVVVREAAGWSVRDVLLDRAGAEPLDRVDVVQVALFAMSVGVALVWASWGIGAEAVAGHSQGEVAAAFVAGGLTLADAVHVVVTRSRLIARTLSGSGGMAVVWAAPERIRPRLVDGVVVAAVNGPEVVVLSGDSQRLRTVADGFEAEGVRVRWVDVDYASHSPAVEAVHDELVDRLGALRPRSSAVAFYSSVHGGLLDTAELDAAYWFRNLREPVDFTGAVAALAADGFRFFVESSPHPGLVGAVEETVGADGVVVGSLRRGEGGLDRLLAAAGDGWVRGLPVDWPRVIGPAPVVEVPTYTFRRQRYWLSAEPPRARTADDWRYRVDWRALPPATGRPPGRWLLVGAPDEVRAALSRSRLEVTDDRDSGPLRGALSFLSDIGDTLELLGALPESVPLYAITRGAVSVAGEPLVDPAQSVLWGLGYSLALARPDRWGGLIDLPATPLDADLLTTLESALSTATENQMAVRPSGLFARRLVRAQARIDRAPWRSRGSALVTGGTGSIGARVARWLLRTGTDHVVLLSRSGPAAPNAAALGAEFGSAVTIVACDITDRAALGRVIGDIADLRTVVHAAGVVDGTAVTEVTAADIARIMRPKAVAAQYLHELTGDLDAFVLFSSGAAVWGSADQGVYGAANAYLDALAAHRRGLGLPATSIAWGAWDGGGMAAEPGAAQRWRRQGVLPMDPHAALDHLERALSAGESGLLVADIDWARLAPILTAARPLPLLAELPEAQTAAEPVEATPGRSFAERLAALPEDEADRALLELVRAEIAAVLGYDGPRADDDDRNLLELGFDSLTTVELRNRLNAATGLSVAVTFLFDHATASELAKALGSELALADDPPVAPADPVSMLFHQAFESGKFAEGMALLRDAARLRPMFDSAATVPHPEPVILAEGDGGPQVICFSALVAMTGAQVYTRFADEFRGQRRVSALPAPGFVSGDSLPATIEAVIDLQTEIIRPIAARAEVVLTGTSSGGWLAHAVAARLERDGLRVAGVVLLDTYLPDADLLRRAQHRVIGGVLDRQAGFGLADGVRLSAMGWYIPLFAPWRPEPITAPTLLIRASEPLRDHTGAALEDLDWRSAWTLPHTVVDVPGDHFTILEEHAASTARAVREWLDR
ncbi:SDR family NAD(P)-dependent oxidoreductase [Nocardia sp. BSTN01]|uniref:SDR family NAD(P)-dependent oxidoreductase n=1 Tax=Nocardia sp. BSTN01 TaxID=2783665 RepID=UPI001E28834D|nr:type I polyketide synthase [Nocardia sp. BSTN01]